MVTSQGVVPRWEWRAFGASFPDTDTAVRALSPDVRTSIDTYLLSRRSDANVKIRHGRIDVKLCEQVEAGLELWRPVLEERFPIPSGTVARLFDYWRLPAPAALRADYGVLQLLGDIVAPRADLLSVVVTKHRASAVIDGCTVESSALSVDGEALHTIAVEAHDPEQVRRVVRALGHPLGANTSYVRALKAQLGLPVSPTDSRAREGAFS